MVGQQELDAQRGRVAVPLNALLALAGVDRSRPHVARCLLIDPPDQLIDLIADWAVLAMTGTTVRPSAIAEAISIQLSDISLVRPERDRLVLRLLAAGLDMGSAMSISDNWIDFSPPGASPGRAFQSALHFGNTEDPVEDLIALLTSNRVREVLFVGPSDWTTSVRHGYERSQLIEFLTLQSELMPGVQLLKFEVSRARPPRVVVEPISESAEQRWEELNWWEDVRRSMSVVGGSRETPRLRLWRSTELPRPFGYPGAPWPLIHGPEASLFRRLDRHYGRLRPEDVSLGANHELDALWLTTDSDQFDAAETRPHASLKNLEGGVEHLAELDRMIWTRGSDNEPLELADLSEGMRSWIYDRSETFAELTAGGRLRADAEHWWSSPWADVPAGPFVALPVLEEHGAPTIFAGGTLTGPGLLWIQPHLLDVEVLAALLTAGPLRTQIRALSPLDSHGRPVLSLDVLAGLKLPRRIHPLIQEDLRAAYRANDHAELARLGVEVYSGNERALLRHRERDSPSLFGVRVI